VCAEPVIELFRYDLEEYMADSEISLIPVRRAELGLGKPLARAIYDRQGKLLLAAGRVIDSQSQLFGLIENGFVQDSSWDLNPAAPKKALLTAATKPSPPPEASSESKDVVVAMDDIRWYVGETLYMQLTDNPSVRYTVRLIGFVKKQMLFVTAPMTDGKLDFIRDGQTFIVRAFAGKKAFAFVATAIKSLHSPYPYLHLSYPKDVRCTVVRRGIRAQVDIRASVFLGQPERAAIATLNDLSVGGASGTMNQVLGTKGEEGRITFKVHAVGQGETLDLKMVLRSVAPGESGDAFKHGFEFLDLSVHDRLLLSAFVHQTVAEGE
jgi:hypothetical protein